MIQVAVTQPKLTTEIHSYEVPSTIVVGRAPKCACRLDADPLVSRCHAVISIRPNGVFVRDLDSLNGIAVNGIHYGGPSSQKMIKPVGLIDGDTVVIGETVFTFKIPMLQQKSAGDTSSNARSGRKKIIREVAAGPRHIPGYLIESIIGNGGMGVVYQAQQLSSGKRVAIKTMHRDLAKDTRAVQHFLREIEVTRRVNHPNIVGFYGSGMSSDSILYMVLEYVDGGDLAQLLDRTPNQRMDPATAHYYAMQIASGLAHAHAMGIVHRDIKPKNILITSDSQPIAKISDLGLAKHEDDNRVQEKGGGGTVAYMPPEQLTRFQMAAPSCDVFSVGATIYEMLCGRRPYDFTNGDKLRAVSKGLIMPITRIGMTIHPGLAAVVDKCISPRPEDRFRDCGQLLCALQAVAV